MRGVYPCGLVGASGRGRESACCSVQEWQTFNFRSFPLIHPHPNLLPSREKGPEPARGTTEEPPLHPSREPPRLVRLPGVRRSGKLLIPFHFVPFPIPEPSSSPSPRGRRDLSLRGGRRGDSREISNLWLIWLYLVLFTPSARLEMRPGWPRLAHRSLVGGGPGWPSLWFCLATWWPHWASSGAPRSGGLLKGSHLVSFGLIPYPPNSHPCLLPGGEGT